MNDDRKQEAPVPLDLERLHGFRHLADLDGESKMEERAAAMFNKIGEETL